jgi:2-polyprenyl-3-methyl-5-hydroxy-6-metoxy-1,4-benzoquinol methylase
MPSQDEVTKTFDAYKDTYAQSVDRAIEFSGLTLDFFTQVKADYIAELSREHFGARSDIQALDVGCGIGNYHGRFGNCFAAISGVDVSSNCIATARTRNPSVEYKVYDGVDLPYSTAQFDVAYAICVMHHVPQIQSSKFVSEMRRVVRPGGLALVFEHNPLNPLTMKAVRSCPFDDDAVLLRSGKTVGLFREAGFSDVAARFILTVPAKNRALLRLDRFFSRFPLGAQYYVSATR